MFAMYTVALLVGSFVLWIASEKTLLHFRQAGHFGRMPPGLPIDPATWRGRQWCAACLTLDAGILPPLSPSTVRALPILLRAQLACDALAF